MQYPSFIMLTAVSGLALVGCRTHTSAEPTLANRAYAPVCLAGVAVYDDFGAVPHDYREVAFISSEQNSVYNDRSTMITDMRKKAGEQGANGLVINSINADKSVAKIIGEAIGASSAQREGRAVAIYMPSDMQRVKDACGKR